MKDALELVALLSLAILVLVVMKVLRRVNDRLLAEGPILSGKLQARRSTSFPLVPTKDSERERRNPGRWLWALVELFVTAVVLVWFLARYR